MSRIITALILSLFIFSCSSQTPDSSTVEIINAEKFKKALDSDPNAIILDVRTPEEFNAGHIENAINIDIFSSDFKQKIEQLPKDKTVLVYCAKGGRSNKAAMALKELNFPVIFDLSGGYSAWPYK